MAFVITSTRRELIEAGALLDVTRLAHAHRIVLPTAITRDAWTTCGASARDFATARGDLMANRILAAARSQAVHSRPASLAADVLGFAVEDAADGHIVELALRVGPGEDGEPVVTIDVAHY